MTRAFPQSSQLISDEGPSLEKLETCFIANKSIF